MAISGLNGDVLITGASTPFTNQALTDSGDHKKYQITDLTKRFFDPAVAPTVQTALNEIQTVSITGAPTGGSFTLTFGAQTTGAIAWNATAAQVQSALQALSSIGAGNVSVAGGPGPSSAWVVTFTGTLGAAGQALMTHADSFTGGTSPAASVTRTQAGAAYATVSATTYTVQSCGGFILFTSTQSALLLVRASGSYLPYSEAGQCYAWEITPQKKMLNYVIFGSTWERNTPSTGSMQVKVSRYYVDAVFANALTNNTLLALVLYIDDTNAPAGPRWECFAYIGQDPQKTQVDALITEDGSFAVDGIPYYYAA